ncbi:MAG: hypothetical protein JSS87_07845 [Acidobacteria bacterium]|nr:hypothetical protein [Acidobacteriota bacterium]
MRRRTRYSVLVVLSLFVLLAIAFVLRSYAPPDVARLLPESDAMIYINFKPIRAATDFQKHPVHPSPDFQKFIDATGIRVERDLDRVAFALHRMDNPNGPNGPVAYSEVMEGHFDAKKLSSWFAANATSTEVYAGHTIYLIPMEGRSFRVTTLGYEMVAASNMPTPEQIHSIIDRHAASASPFSGSSLLSARYHEVPLFSRSLAWGIGHVGLPFSENGKITIAGVHLPLDAETDLIVSLSYRGSLHMRIEEIAPTEAVALSTRDNLATLLNLIRGVMPYSVSTPEDKSTHDFLNSLRVEQHADRVIITGNIPTEFLERISHSP